MSADPADRRQLGKLLVDKGVLTEEQLQRALAEQQASGSPLGEVIVRLGFSSGPTIGNALAEQHGGPLRTEYGLALGPTTTRLLAQPAEPGTPARDVRGLLRVPEPSPKEASREQDTAIARLTGALDARTEELERVRNELAAAEQESSELASARARLATLQAELAEAREEQALTARSLEQLEQDTGALADAERALHAARVVELQQELDERRSDRDELAANELAHRELELELRRQRASGEAIADDLRRALAERAELTARSDKLQQELEHALGRDSATAERLGTVDELQRSLAQRDADLERAQKAIEHARSGDSSDASRARDLELALQRQKGEADEISTDLRRALDEQAELARRADKLKQELEHALARECDAAERLTRIDELERTVERQETELIQVREALARQRDNSATLETQLETFDDRTGDETLTAGAVHTAKQRALVATATARARRGYGPAIRTAVDADATPVQAGAENSRSADTNADESLARNLEVAVADTTTTPKQGRTIKLWQVVALLGLSSASVYLIVSDDVLPAAACAALLLAVVIMCMWRTTPARTRAASPAPSSHPPL